MRFKSFNYEIKKKHSDEVAELLTRAGVRIKRRKTVWRGKPRFVVTVHPEDVDVAVKTCLEARQREKEMLVSTLQFRRQPFSDRDMLLAQEPNEAGYRSSCIYHGEPFDESKFRIVRRGWDHEHCYLCYDKILPGDDWWVTRAPRHVDEIGLCLACHLKMFGANLPADR